MGDAVKSIDNVASALHPLHELHAYVLRVDPVNSLRCAGPGGAFLGGWSGSRGRGGGLCGRVPGGAMSPWAGFGGRARPLGRGCLGPGSRGRDEVPGRWSFVRADSTDRSPSPPQFLSHCLLVTLASHFPPTSRPTRTPPGTSSCPSCPAS